MNAKMKTKLIILALCLISCGESGPSACDCAVMSSDRINGMLETLTKSQEEQDQINANWEEKLAPCQKKIEEDGGFEKEMGACVLKLLELELNEDNENKNER